MKRNPNSKYYLRTFFRVGLVVAALGLLAFNGFGQPWTYDFGTGTGSYNTASGISTTFLSGTPAGGGTYRIRCATTPNQGSGFVLANPGTSLGSESELQINASITASTNKFGVYDWSSTSTVSYIKYKIRTTSSGNGVLAFMLGINTVANDNSGYTGHYNNSLTSFWITYTAGSISSVSRRGGGATVAIASHGFTKDTDQEVEIFGNNGGSSTTYFKNATTYTLNSQAWDLWVDGAKVSPDNGWPKANTLASGTNLSGFAFSNETSASNAAFIYIDAIEYSNALPTSVCPVTITGINPASGSPGTVVTLTGTNFTGTSVVTYNSVAVSSYTVINPTTIEATIPAGTVVGTTAAFTVTQGCDVTSSLTFTVTCPVTVTSFTPTTGPIGTLVTITGTDFLGATSVAFNGTSAIFDPPTIATTITATVPAGASTGKVAVTKGCTGTSAGDFTGIGQTGTCSSSTHIDENIQSWTNHASYGSYTQAIAAGPVNLTRCIVQNTALASGAGSVGRVQLEASTGILELPEVTDVGNVQFNIAAGANGRTVKLQSFNGATWVDLTTFTSINTTGATFTYSVNSAVPTTLRLASPSNAVYVHDVVLNSVTSTSVNITTQPTSQSQCDGGDATFTVVATGTPTYQWRWLNAGAWEDISGETLSTLTLTGITPAMNGYQYYCVVTEGTCNVPTIAVHLTIGSCCVAPANNPTALTFTNVTANSMDVDWTAPALGCDGYVVKIRRTDASFVDLVDGVSLPSGSSAPWNDEDIVLTGSASLGFTIGSLGQNTTYHYKVYPYNLCGSTYKFNNTGLTGNVTTSTQSYPTPVCAEGAVTLSLVNANETSAEYQWQVFDGSSWSDLTDVGSYSGATGRELTIDPVLQTMNGYIYVCQVSNSVLHGCTTPSVSFTITVNPLPDTPIIESVTQNCGSTDLTMGTPPIGVTWFWQTTADGTDTGNSALTLNVIADGTYYLRAVSADGCWSTNCASELVTVKEVPSASLTLNNGCGSGTAEITSTITGVQTFELLNDAGAPLIPPRSATFDGNSYTFNGIVNDDYTAIVTYNGCSSALTAVETMANDPIAGEPSVSDETICGAGTATLSATLGTDADRIEWSFNDVFTDGLNGDETDTGPYQFDVALLDGQTIPVYVRSNNAGNCPSGWEIVNAISTPSVAAPVFNVGLPVVHCQGAGTDTFTATSAETIVYSITINSGTGTNPTINSATGEVIYPADFYGDITISATVTGCNVAAATHDVEVVKTLDPTITIIP